MDAKWLTELKDIHYPSPVSWLALAPGWWMIFGIMSVLVLYGFWRWRRYSAANRAKKYALSCLKALEHTAKTQQSEVLLASEVDAVLKRTALFFFPRESLASLSGEAWLDFLVAHDKRKEIAAYRFELTILPYQQQASGKKMANIPGLLRAARAWVKQRRLPCSP